MIVYRHIRLDKNEPFYIGISNNLKRPYSKRGRNNIWNKIINKTDYEVEILFDDLTWEEAQEKEKEFIKLYGRIDIKTGVLANLTDGGEGTQGILITEETRNRMSLSQTGNKRSEESILKQILKTKGKKLNYKQTEEHKSKIGLKHKGKPWSEARRLAQQKKSKI